ncbi:PH domain-containing protein [Embleya sp. NBC_00888]|uniref:PH domain-containing protein n=1 Tax=Embleya sp. NBC_00888 TaxID=2975960 RepID=UPI003866F3BB|nr:PH domain-containing protein [Embleya sp. NBC_00888]
MSRSVVPETLHSPWRGYQVGLGSVLAFTGLATFTSPHISSYVVAAGLLAVGLWCAVQASRSGVLISPEGLVHRGMGSSRSIAWEEIADIRIESAAGKGGPSSMTVLVLVDETVVALQSLAGYRGRSDNARVERQTARLREIWQQ